MADVTITAANCKAPGTTAKTGRVPAGGTIGHAQPLFKHTDNKFYAADNDDTAVKAVVEGISFTPAGANDLVYIITEGPFVVGGTLVQGTEYYLSSNVGGICPRADLNTGDFITRLGIASSATVLDVKIHATGVQVP